MVKHYFRIAFRGLLKNKVFGFVNILGLAISMLCCFFIAQYAIHEFSYDDFHVNGNNIYRINYSRYLDGELQYKKAQVFPGVGETVNAEVPQVKNSVRIFPVNIHIETLFSIDHNQDKKSFQETSVVAVDDTFLSIFSIILLKGDSATALQGENKILLSETAAQRYFGDTDPINQVIAWDGMGEYTVSGVFKSLPENSHMNFEFITSWLDVAGGNSKWNWDGFYTYVLLEEGTNLKETTDLIQMSINSKTHDAETKNRVSSIYELKPLKSIHLESNLLGEMQPNGSKKTVITLIISGIIILIIAIVNYTNLSLARIFKRTKEVGVRKVIGSSSAQLINQFFIESLTINLLALSIAIVLHHLLNDSFNALIGIQTTPIFSSNVILVCSILTGLILLIAAIASLIPSKYLVSQGPIKAIKGLHVNVSTGTFMKRSLLAFQFLSTAVLISGAIIIYKQIRFMRNQDLGYEINQKLIVKTLAGPGAEMDSVFQQQMELFKNLSAEIPTVGYTTITSNIPGRENDWQGRIPSNINEEQIQIYRTRIDPDFFDTYKINFIASKEITASENAAIINESAAKQLGYSDPAEAIGNILFGEKEIVGVVKDYNEQSLHTKIAPAMYTFGQGYMKFITVDIDSDVAETVKALEGKWNTLFPDKPFEYFFLDSFFDQQYARDQRLGNVSALFSAISIFIACLGLFGFSYFVVYQRIKEIGIRKVLGASTHSLINLLMGEFLVVILISSAFSIPIVIYLANMWLADYAYRIDLNPIYFILPTLIVVGIAFITIIMHLLQALRANPADSLKYE